MFANYVLHLFPLHHNIPYYQKHQNLHRSNYHFSNNCRYLSINPNHINSCTSYISSFNHKSKFARLILPFVKYITRFKNLKSPKFRFLTLVFMFPRIRRTGWRCLLIGGGVGGGTIGAWASTGAGASTLTGCTTAGSAGCCSTTSTIFSAILRRVCGDCAASGLWGRFLDTGVESCRLLNY